MKLIGVCGTLFIIILNTNFSSFHFKVNAFNVYQISLYQHLNFMHQVNYQETPRILFHN